MTLLVTGANGFVGKHMVRKLHTQGHEVIGSGQQPQSEEQIASLLKAYWSCDLTDKDAVKRLPLESIDAVISLAGLAKVGASFSNAELYQRVNVKALSVLAEEILSRGLETRVVAISTGQVYQPDQPLPLTEESEVVADGQASPYALSKLKMEQAANDLIKRGLDCVIARPFNHIGPGQEPGFLLPDLYQKVMTAKTTGSSIKVGNLSTRRDYTDVRDVVKAYAALATAQKLAHELYNICSGHCTTGQEILELLSNTLSGQEIKVERDPALIRPNDPSEIYGSFERLKNDTGWSPTIPLATTIADFVTSHG
jgi:GDP-4-dehydro-6-deoxy-D-mannose reductase